MPYAINTETGLPEWQGTALPVEGRQSIRDSVAAQAVEIDELQEDMTEVQAAISVSGSDALTSISIPDGNLEAITTGTRNTFIGAGAGDAVTVGDKNTFIGVDAATTTTGTQYSVVIGDSAFKVCPAGASNVVIGKDAAVALTSSTNDSVIIGAAAVPGTGSASRGVYIGSGVTKGDSSPVNEIVIGYGAIGSGDNSVTIGNTDTVGVRLAGTSCQCGELSVDGERIILLDHDGNTPATATWAGTKGTFKFSATHAYFCIATNTWRRVAIAAW